MSLTDEYMTASEAARILGVHPLAVSHMCAAGRLPAEKLAYRWLIRRHSLEEFAKTYIPMRGRPRKKRIYTKRSQTWFTK